MDMQLLLDAWRGGGPPHRRLDRMLRAMNRDNGPASDALGRDSLGMRNQRLLRLHARIEGGPLEAVAKCPACDTLNEFALPGDLLLELPPPAAGEVVTLDGAKFRLPRMDDLLSDDPRPLAERCCETIGAAPPETAMARAGEALNEIDPAANPVFDLSCSACGTAYRAAADIAAFVAAAFDRLAARLLRDVDTIASAYGWSEQAIAALPAERRRRYVETIAARAWNAR